MHKPTQFRDKSACFSAETGFTLIEIVLVIVFLSVALLATMNMMSSSVSGSFDMELSSTAANLANEKMERIFADKRSRGYGYIVENNYPVETDPDGFSGFTRSVTIITQSTYKEVRVTVSHPQIHDCVLVSFLTNY
ncbi:MAG: hypothetical protein D6743_12840 [Calditrichaeota bacterium]|nr:MAG: hypothetical protein D6743_12840 [Calditrichota bacterium]